MRSTTKGVLLGAVADAAVQRDDTSVSETAEDLDLAGDLLAELPRRYDNKRERRAGASLDSLEDGEREGAGLTGAGLGLREEIAA